MPESGVIDKFLQSGKACKDDPNYDYKAFRKQHYFFYGTLMDPTTLAKILQLRGRPYLGSARLVGYSCMLWGPYPALTDGPPGATVFGVAYEVQTCKEVERLHTYETDNYTATPCLIHLNDGRELRGKSFVWTAGEVLLTKSVFDLKDWQMKNLEMS